MPLGIFLGPLEALLGGIKNKTMQTFQRENHFFEHVAFLVFEALDGPLGLVLPPSWADLVPKWAPKWAPKVVQKVDL